MSNTPIGQAPVGPQGPQGIPGPVGPLGPAGPSTPSADVGNELSVGTDDLLFYKIPYQVDQPTNTAPPDGAVDQLRNPTLAANAFNYLGAPETHVFSEWGIATDIGFQNIVWQSGIDPTNLESIVVPIILQPSTQYYWVVRYSGSVSGWSLYSLPTGFVTTSDNVDTPINEVPANEQVDVATSPRLVASTFGWTGTGAQTHVASQWQVASDIAFNNIAWDSGATGIDLTSTKVATTLEVLTTYYWRVRYLGSTTGASAWSAGTSFITFDGFSYKQNWVDNGYLSASSVAKYQTDVAFMTAGLSDKFTLSFWSRSFQIFTNTIEQTILEIGYNTAANQAKIKLTQFQNSLRLNVGSGNTNDILSSVVIQGLPAGFTFADPHHFLISRNGTTIQIAVDGEIYTWSLVASGALQDFDLMRAISVGTSNLGTIGGDFAFADVWFQAGVFLDNSIRANIFKFVTSIGEPVYLGENGELPTGTSPDVYAGGSMLASQWNSGTNLGTVQPFNPNTTWLFEDIPQNNYVQNVVLNNEGYIRTQDLAQPTDSNTITISFWHKRKPPFIAQQTIFENSAGIADLDGRLRIYWTTASAASTITIQMGSSSQGNLATIITTNAIQGDHKLQHFMFTRNATFKSIYVDEVNQAAAANPTTTVQSFTLYDVFNIGARGSATQPVNMEIADLWYGPDIDLRPSQIENLRLFIDPLKRPVYLGQSGELPSGGILPTVFFGSQQLASEWNAGNNQGSAGGAWQQLGPPYTDLPPLEPNPYSQNGVNPNTVSYLYGNWPAGQWVNNRFSMSIWLTVFGSPNAKQIFTIGEGQGTTNYLQGYFSSNLIISVASSAFATVNTPTQPTFNSRSVHLMFSIDGSNVQIAADGVVLLDTVAAGGVVGAELWTDPRIFVNIPTTQAVLQTDYVGDLWMSDQALDLSDSAVIDKFRDSKGYPVSLGDNGELPTGIAPQVFVGGSAVAADWNAGTNQGTGPDLTSGIGSWASFTDIGSLRQWFLSKEGYLLPSSDQALISALNKSGISLQSVLSVITSDKNQSINDYLDISKLLIEILKRL